MSNASVHEDDEDTPLLARQRTVHSEHDGEPQKTIISFSKEDPEDPRQWPIRKKIFNVFIICVMAIMTPLASSMFTPGINQIAEDLHARQEDVVAATTGFVVCMGIGPLILAPLSETFGRRPVYIWTYLCFGLLQIPCALSPNVASLIAFRTLAGFFGSVGIANGGGTINDMFLPRERASVLGWYLVGPLLGPTLGPVLGGLLVHYLHWRWIFWVMTMICLSITTLGYFFLQESFARVLLARRAATLSKEHGGEYTFEGEDTRALHRKIGRNVQRPLRLLTTQPVIIVMSMYQALIFSCIYSLYTNMQQIFGEEPYGFSTLQVGLLYLGPGAGFMIALFALVPRIDTIFNALSERAGKEEPEFRLPIANIGAVLLPVSLLWFGWSIEFRLHWFVAILATVFFGIGQVTIFNAVQNYYIDAFSTYAASAIAAGALFRAIVGGIIPLAAPSLFKTLGYGWGWSLFAFIAVALAPTPLIFMKFGKRIREWSRIEL